jgi:hypothetical protein
VNPRHYAIVVGAILVVLAIAGWVEGETRLLGDVLWFDNTENVAHTTTGLLALIVGLAVRAAQRGLAIVYGIAGLIGGTWGFLVAGSPELNFYGAMNLENPIDNVLHLVVGVWGVAVAFLARSGAS